MIARRGILTAAAPGQRQAPRFPVAVRAQSSDDDEAEARLEALERARKRGKGSGDLETELRKATAQGMVDRESSGQFAAPWKEGELFPEGWEKMNLFEKFYNAYMGERGLLFWANKLAFGAVFVVIGAWIVFRFVGPAIGLYKLS